MFHNQKLAQKYSENYLDIERSPNYTVRCFKHLSCVLPGKAFYFVASN